MLDSNGESRYRCVVCGRAILPGETYEIARPYRRVVVACQDHCLRPSHLASGERLRDLLVAVEDLLDAWDESSATGNVDGLLEARNEAVAAIQQSAQAYWEADAATGRGIQAHQERAMACEDCAEQLRAVEICAFEIDPGSTLPEDEQLQEWEREIDAALTDAIASLGLDT